MTIELSKEQLQKLKEQMVNEGFPECSIELFDIHTLLSNITILDIEKKIEKFRMIDLKKISNEDLSNELMEVLSVNINGAKQSILFPRFIEYPAKTRFYRVRKISSNDTSIPCNTISKEQDVWNPPVELILRPGRLNKVHESLLYTSPISPFAAIEEMKIQEDEKFGLIVYESEFPIKAIMIGFWEDIPELTEEENLKLRIFTHFLYTEFTRDVGVGTEYLYRVSEMIAKIYFDSPQDAWCYPSIAIKSHVNACFRPDIAKALLRFVGVQFCQLNRFNEMIQIKCNYIASGIDSNKKLLYSTIDSDLCRQLFPEIKLKNN